MAIERFPKAKYLRQLAQMQHDFQAWRLEYLHAAEKHPDEWLGDRMKDRAEDLNKAILQLVELRDTVYGLPRLQ